MEPDTENSKLTHAIASFNRGEYFDAAERFESALDGTEPALKGMVTALNQIAAALHLRFERGSRQGAINLMSQAMIALEELRPAAGGIDVERLYGEVSAMVAEIRAAPRGEADGLKHRARIFLERRRAPVIKRAAK